MPINFTQYWQFNLVTIAWVIAAILIVFRQMTSARKRDTRKVITLFALGFGVVAILPLLLTAPILTNSLNVGTATLDVSDVTQPASIVGCGVEDTTVTLAATNKYTGAAVGGQHAYKINGGATLRVSDAGTFTASPGDKIQIMFGNATNDHENGYFSELVSEEIDCKGAQTFTGLLLQNGTITLQVYNEESNLIDTATENETIAAGDTPTLRFVLKGTYQRGVPHGGVLVLEANKSSYDKLILDLPGSASVSVPDVDASTYADNIRFAYSTSAILSNTDLEGKITLDAGSTFTKGTSANEIDVLLRFYTLNPFLDENAGGIFSNPAVEDENNALTQGHISTFTLNVD